MAQIVKLRRTSTAGKVPTTSNLELGELAMNTNDGRIFFEKNDGSATIQEILTTNPNNPTTGSINLNGSFTASAGIQVAANIMPNADNTLSLGSSTLRFQLNGGTPVTVDGSGTANTLTRFQSATTVEDSNIVSSNTATTFTHSNNGNTIFTVSGSNGELLTITDSNTGNLLEVNDASGIDVFTVSAVGDVSASGAITASGFNVINDVSVTGNISGSSFNGTGLVSGSAGLSYATSTVRGVVELFSNTTQTVAANSVSSTASRTYGIQLNSSNQAVVNVPWSNTTFSVSDLNGTGVVSGSVLRPNGDGVFSGSLEDLTKGTNVVSGSGQIAVVTNGTDIVSGSVLRPNGDNVISGSDQLDGFVSASNSFTANEIIIADDTDSVTSSNLLTIDPNNNRVGVGTSSPSTKFHIAGDGNNEGQIRLQQANNGADGPDIAFYSSRGTIASPSAVQNNDTHGRINAYPYNGTNHIQAGSFGWSATDGTGNNTFDIRSRVSGTLAKRIEITSAGKVKFNDTYEFPTSDGSANQVLQTNGSGVLSFGTITTYTDSDNTSHLNSLGVFSGSAQVYNTFSGSGLISSSVEGSSQGQINLNGSAVNVNALGTNDSPSFTNLTVTGDLTVQGTTTTENSQQVNIGDNILNLNYGGSSTTGGIYVSDGTGGSTLSGSLLWDATNDYWKAGKLGSEQKLIRENGDGIVTQSAQIDAQSASNPSAIYDSSGTPTLRSTITQGELQTAIGVDAAGTKNSTDVSLAGSYDYITAGGTDNQTLTLNQIDLATDVTGTLPSDNLDADTAHLSGTQTFTGAKTFNASGNSIIISDTLRIAEDGSGMRMTNVGAFESSSAGFHIFSNDDLRISTNGSGAGTTALTLDKTTKDATFEGNILAGNISGSSFNGTGLVSGSSQLSYATSTARGVIELFSSDLQAVGANTVTDTAGRTYGIQLNSDNQAVVNVPWSPDGGNATTLDSIDSSGFIRANADDDVSAHTEWQDSKEIRLGSDNDTQLYHNGTNMFLANGTGNLIIRNNTNNGNVVLQSDDGAGGIATYLYLDGTNEKVQIDKPADISDTTQSDAKTTGAFVVDGGVGIAKTLNVGEDVVAYASSDERYKDNVTPIENPNEKLKQIGGYTFDWNDKHEVFKGQHDVGVIAQEIEKVLPEIVETRESGYKAVKYEKIVALLIESNKELLKRVEELESKLK